MLDSNSSVEKEQVSARLPVSFVQKFERRCTELRISKPAGIAAALQLWLSGPIEPAPPASAVHAEAETPKAFGPLDEAQTRTLLEILQAKERTDDYGARKMLLSFIETKLKQSGRRTRE